ncbi:hypothetical protein MIH18_02795 [Marinobacter sp. M3C]|uniref:hypothetical protein n=1 Tax=Marinobacter sp. M3C TaxID=2917715 RepID=UPI00200EB210|nr:hypothetical protein [Marinobacter sp. M3C]UQG60899.1 hypothetical protein MIH18_02795 [Marinobacter sp. M3C]
MNESILFVVEFDEPELIIDQLQTQPRLNGISVERLIKRLIYYAMMPADLAPCVSGENLNDLLEKWSVTPC